MERNSRIPPNLHSFRSITSSEKQKDPANRDSSFKTIIPQQGTKNKLLAQRFKVQEEKVDLTIEQINDLDAEVQRLNFWADSILNEKGQAELESSEESPASGGGNVLESPARPEVASEPRPDSETTKIEPPADIQMSTIHGNFFKASARPSGMRKLVDVVTKRAPSSSTPRSANRKPQELPPLEPSLLPSSDAKRRAFAGAKSKEIGQRVLRRNLPPGLIFDTQGNVFGKYSFTKLSSPGKGRVLLETVFCEKMSAFLKSGSDKVLPPKLVGDVLVIDPCAADFHRLNYNFTTKEGRVIDLPWPTDEQANQYRIDIQKPGMDIKTCKEYLRAAQIAASLRDFVIEDNASENANSQAALVLSAVLAQHTSMLLANVVYGGTSPFKMLSNQSTAQVGRTVTIKDRHGNEHPVDVKAFGATVFTISREGNDFKVTVDFPWYAEARDGREKEFPLHKDGVIGIHTTAELLVDADKARAGLLSVKFLNGIQAEYSGRLDLNFS